MNFGVAAHIFMGKVFEKQIEKLSGEKMKFHIILEEMDEKEEIKFYQKQIKKMVEYMDEYKQKMDELNK